MPEAALRTATATPPPRDTPPLPALAPPPGDPADLETFAPGGCEVLAWSDGAALRLAHDGVAWRIDLAPARPVLLLLRVAPAAARLDLGGSAAAWAAPGGASVHVLAPGCRLRGVIEGTAEGVALALDPAVLEAARAAPETRLGCDDAALAALLASLEQACAARSLPTARAIAGAVAARLASLHPAPAARGPAGLQTWRLRRVEAFIEANLGERLALADLAGAAGLSAFHFARGFTRTTGLTPFAYLRRRRCARACELLATTSLTLAEIARRCGFGTQSQFTSVFHAAEGLPPGRWRALARAG